MDIPSRMVQIVSNHVFAVISHSGAEVNLSDLSKSCGELILREAKLHPGEFLAFVSSLDSVVAWAERFGKHLGIFFLAEKEG